ncbi:MAG TPA: FkbM family methyltransferase, partial [Gemmatimonadales bacterium]|nr:FkbM family methyltransferase [Gemmatimonadales bacterium]
LPNWRVPRYPMAMCLRELFELLEVDCVLDVGANVGQYRNFLRAEVGYTGRIVSFEPIPRNVARLRERAAADPAWRIEPHALGAVSGPASFNVTAESVFSSFLKPTPDSAGLFGGESEVTERIEVQVRTLDEVLPGLEREYAPRRMYLKLDTQGYDLEVVRGGHASMGRFCGLQSEASVKPIYCDMPDYATAIKELEALGFELTGLFPVASGTFPRLVEFDCIMVASAFAHAARRTA